jgi:hypothetical protein
MSELLLPANHRAVIAYIRRYGPVLSRDLEAMFSVTGSQVREIVRHYRREGELIVSGSQGYWYAADWPDFEKAMYHLESRALDMLETMKYLIPGLFVLPQKK